MSGFTVGQRLWFVSKEHPRRAPHFVTIAKVGRKWLNLEECGGSNVRADIQTLSVSAGDFHCGQCYLSREAWEPVYLAEQAWGELRKEIGFKIPEGLDAETIEFVRKLFAIPTEKQRVAAMLRFVRAWNLEQLYEATDGG